MPLRLTPETLFQMAGDYWTSKCEGSAVPNFSDLDPSEIPQILPYILLIDVHRDPLDFSYGLTGGMVRNLLPMNRRGQRMSTLPGKGTGSTVWANLEAMISTPSPREYSIPYDGGRAVVDTVRYLALPWSKGGHEVGVVSHVVWVPPDIRFVEQSDMPTNF